MLNNLRPRGTRRRPLLRPRRILPRNSYRPSHQQPRRHWRTAACALALLILGAWWVAHQVPEVASANETPRTSVSPPAPMGPSPTRNPSPVSPDPDSVSPGSVSSDPALSSQSSAQPTRPPQLVSPRNIPSRVLKRLPATRADLDRLMDPSAQLNSFDGTALREWVKLDGTPADLAAERSDGFRLEYTLHPDLSDRILELLERQKVALGQVLVADAHSGRLLAYALTNPERFGPDRTYPAASLAKIITAAAVLDSEPEAFERGCVYTGSRYKLTRARLQPPRRGTQVSLIKALAMSNNQCFGRLAAHTLGSDRMRNAFSSFGWMRAPAPGYPAGRIEPGEDEYALAQLGSGLAGSSITPLHAVELALSLVSGQAPRPFWISRIEDAQGQHLQLPERPTPRRVMKKQVADELRRMLVETTVRGTARRAFRLRSGRPLLQKVRVAGKTGSLSGTDPEGHYGWFVGVAPAEAPSIAIAVVTVHGNDYLQTSSQLAAEVLRGIFCPQGVCADDAARAWLSPEPPISPEIPPHKPASLG